MEDAPFRNTTAFSMMGPFVEDVAQERGMWFEMQDLSPRHSQVVSQTPPEDSEAYRTKFQLEQNACALQAAIHEVGIH